MPVLQNQVNLYLCGHDHNLQELQADSDVYFLVIGGGGASPYDCTQKNYARSAFKAKENGFTVIEADQSTLQLSIVDREGLF